MGSNILACTDVEGEIGCGNFYVYEHTHKDL
jgi:hypothetical protein